MDDLSDYEKWVLRKMVEEKIFNYEMRFNCGFFPEEDIESFKYMLNTYKIIQEKLA